MRVLIRGENQETLKRLDAHLWTYRDDSWLPHGIEGEVDVAQQPILLTNQSTNANGATALFIVENAPLGDTLGIERGFYMIDGNDHNLVTLARKEYKAAKENGHDISYWQQSESGKWGEEGVKILSFALAVINIFGLGAFGLSQIEGSGQKMVANAYLDFENRNIAKYTPPPPPNNDCCTGGQQIYICDATEFQNLVGRKDEAALKTLYPIGSNFYYSSDKPQQPFIENRLNIEIGRDRRITRVFCS